MSLEEKIGALIVAIEANTSAVLYGPETATKTEEAKPETAKQKKARLAKEKKAAAPKGGKITVESVKALAKKKALASDDPKECMNQIREVVGVVAETCYEDVNVGIDKFDETGLALLNEELTSFAYTPPEPEATAEPKDDLEI